MAEFCANNMLSRGISFKKVEGSNDKSTSEKGFRELMNNLKTNNYFMLCKDRLLDTFVIEKGAINKEFLEEYQGNIPDYSNETLKKRSGDLIKKVFNNDMVNKPFNLKNKIKKIKKTKNEFRNYYNSLGGFFLSKDDDIHNLFLQLQTQDIMISTVNELIRQAMLLLILYNDRITDKESCLDDLMNHFKMMRFSINKSIVSKRQDWINSTKTPIGSSGMQKLSLQFVFYLHSLIENGFNFDIVKTLDKENHKSYMKYNENFELSATAVNEHLKFISEDNAKITEVQVERVKELALEFFHERGFNAGEKDLIYCVKAFCFELFICGSYYREKGMRSKLLFERMDHLSRNETIFLYSSFDRAFFRQNRVLDYYRKFYDVLFRFYRLTGKTFYTLSPGLGIQVLNEILIEFLKFFDSNKF